MLRFVLKAVVAVALFVAVAEGMTRWVLPRVGPGMIDLEDFYAPAQRVAARGPLTHITVGSSRVASAIRADTLQTILRAAALRGEGDAPGRAPEDVHAVNAGKGYATLHLHYLGLRNLIAEHPESLEGVTVFVEAPAGLAIYNTWDSGWVGENWPTLLAPLLRAEDLPRFLSQSENTVAAKARVLGAYFLQFTRYLQYVRPRLEDAVNSRFAMKKRRDEGADLSTAGGVRADEEGVALTREQTRRLGIEEFTNQEPWRDWDRSIWADVVAMVRAHGGDVVFFEMPISSVAMQAGATDLRREDKRYFDAWREANGLALLRPQNFEYTDEDFPDLMHLRKSRSAEFTARLAEAYLARRRGATAPPPAAAPGSPPATGPPGPR
jgi:hypothetical protein